MFVMLYLNDNIETVFIGKTFSEKTWQEISRNGWCQAIIIEGRYSGKLVIYLVFMEWSSRENAC
jgi:hypothetical protein